MAVKDSEELSANEQYPLGDYSFRIERSAGTSPGYDKIEAICTKGGKNARKSIQVPSSTKIGGWYVEANNDTADVYVKLSGSALPDISYSGGGSCTDTYTKSNGRSITDTFTSGAEACCYIITNATNSAWLAVFASHSPFTVHRSSTDQTQGDYAASKSTYEGQDYYYASHGIGMIPGTLSASAPINGYFPGISPSLVAAAMLFENEGSGTKLVGRFAIEIKDAGGDGPGSDWVDPGDYDPDWEEGDPTHTLYVEVTGALSGRHNDPIEDPSYSYIPADKDTVKDYGCGGDGGHGGGGGAGASTVVIHKFATNQANSKEVTALARRHGYGSGGGKGGKGGDGCILVYY